MLKQQNSSMSSDEISSDEGGNKNRSVNKQSTLKKQSMSSYGLKHSEKKSDMSIKNDASPGGQEVLK